MEKLELKKEQIVNLNDADMQQIQGGVAASTWWCVVSTVLETIQITISLSEGDDEPENDGGTGSQRIITTDDGNSCLLDEVVVESVATS